MTRTSSSYLKSLLLIISGALYAGAAGAVPDIWEAKLGATVSFAAAPALDDIDDGVANLTFGTMSFPFGDKTYSDTDILSISSNGFISIGGDNDSDAAASGLTLTGDSHPRIAPFWTDLFSDLGGDVFVSRFNDDGDAAIDRIVITFATANRNTCAGSECAILVQVQLLETGTIIFGYNGIGLNDPGNTVADDLVVGIASDVTAGDPGSTDLNAALPLDTMMVPNIYQLFTAATDAIDLDNSNLVFTRNLTGGFGVDDSMLNPPESTGPEFWETRIGTTLDGQALDNVDDGVVDLTFGSLVFPFAGDTYDGTDILNISSNGFISLGGSNGDDCCNGEPGILVGDVHPRIAPFWTDLSPLEGGDIFINRLADRIVITFATGLAPCNADECSVLVQVQLLDTGNIIFGYNGIDLINALDNFGNNVLVGLSPGIGSIDPGSSNFSDTAPFNVAPGTAVYELFESASAPPVDLNGGNIVFEPLGDGFKVTAPGISGAAIGGGAKDSGNEGHCSLGRKDAAPDPTLWLLLLASGAYLLRRRIRRATAG